LERTIEKIEFSCSLKTEQQESMMEAFTGITANDILRERDEARVAGRLAHTANTNGDFMAWLSCNCNSCRDYFDPTGEEDARRRNCQTPPPPPPPPSPPILRRQNAICIECGVGHSSSQVCIPPFPPLSPISTNAFPSLTRSTTCDCSLPPPPPAVRSPRLLSYNSSLTSPVLPSQTPRSLSETLSIEEEITNAEKSLVRRLNRMLETYSRFETHLQNEEANSRSHDEMMMYQIAWDEMDKKRSVVEKLLCVLNQ
jgi:hypothetical protein